MRPAHRPNGKPRPRRCREGRSVGLGHLHRVQLLRCDHPARRTALADAQSPVDLREVRLSVSGRLQRTRLSPSLEAVDGSECAQPPLSALTKSPAVGRVRDERTRDGAEEDERWATDVGKAASAPELHHPIVTARQVTSTAQEGGGGRPLLLLVPLRTRRPPGGSAEGQWWVPGVVGLVGGGEWEGVEKESGAKGAAQTVREPTMEGGASLADGATWREGQ